jgi:glycosyltransferase involved in cell wall biosynthesis
VQPVRVSVIIPAFRRPEGVREAIASALAQTHPVDEVIVVDDASGDGTPEAVRSIADPRVRLVALAENRGQSGALNAGLDAATGDVIALLDSDDLWMPDKIATQLAAWAADPERERTLYSSRVRNEVDGELESIGPGALLRPGERVDDYLFVRNGLVQTSTLFVSRSFAQAVRFDDRTRRHGDLAFVLRVIAHGGRVVQLHEPLTRYRSSRATPRISSTANLDSSLKWLESYAPQMSARAVTAFRYRNHIKILRRTDPPAAAVLTAKALAIGAVGWRDVRRHVEQIARKLRRRFAA